MGDSSCQWWGGALPGRTTFQGHTSLTGQTLHSAESEKSSGKKAKAIQGKMVREFERG